MKSLLAFLMFLPALMQTNMAGAQDSTAGNVAVVISPAVFMPVSVAVQVGVQIKLNRRTALLTEFAYPTFYPQNDYEIIRYWRGSAELKWYPRKPEQAGNYLALKTAYTYRTLTDRDEGIVHDRDGEYRYDNAIIHSPVVSLALLVGTELSNHTHKFFADVFAGAGVRHLFNRYDATNLRITSLSRQRDSFDWLIPDDGWRFNYALTRLYVTGGLRFGMHL